MQSRSAARPPGSQLTYRPEPRSTPHSPDPVNNNPGWFPVQSISPIGCPHAAQSLSRYHLAMMLRTRQSAPDSLISLRHSCPHPAFSGQREHSLSRNSGALPNTVAAACAASNTTPAGRWFSGHVITRWPRYFHQALPNRHTATPANPTTTRSIKRYRHTILRNYTCKTVAVRRRFLPISSYPQGFKPDLTALRIARARQATPRCGLFRTA